MAKLYKPTFITSVVGDALVSETNAEELKQWIEGDSRIITLDDSDHLLSKKQDTKFVSEEIVRWFNALFSDVKEARTR